MSTVAKKVLMGSGAVAEAYEIEQSIIYNSGAAPQMYFDPSSNFTSETVFTFSTWVKRASTGASQRLLTAGYYAAAINQSGVTIQFHSSDVLRVNFRREGSVTYNNQSIDSTALFRDPAAWYHILVTRNGTAIKGYVNGVEVLSGTMTANSVVGIQNTYPVMVGVSSKPTSSAVGAYESFNGNLAETHFIDGTAKATSDFGETNSDTGQWIPKEYTGGSYGTNGFYLKFVSGAIGTDSSGNSNTMTVANLANSDVVIDTPTNNFATLLPFAGFGTYTSNTPTTTAITTSEGNLVGTGASGINGSGSMAVSSGKWYWEVMVIGSSGYGHAGIYGYGSGRISDSLRADNGNKYRFMLNADDGEWQYATNGGSFSSAAAITGDGGNAVNGPWAASLTCFGTGSKLHFNFGQNGTFNGAATAGGNADSGGVGDFFYAPPSGYLALCTANLPDPAIPLPSAHFNTVLYTGNGGTNAITGVGFQPDWVWAKVRDAGYSHGLFDAVRGVTKKLSSNLTDAEVTSSGLTAFGSDGFTMGSDAGMNGSSKTYVSWNWKANGSGSNDTSGDIDAVVSANQTAGFSIVTWTSNGSNDGTVPHGLGVAPEVVLYKVRSATSNWNWWTTVIDGSNDYLQLNTTAAKVDLSSAYGNLTSSFFTNLGFANSATVVAYCFVSKPSFSKVGSYTGNGSADGPMVNLGFKPAWVMIKKSSAGGAGSDWYIYDAARSPVNEINYYLRANTADAEAGMDKFDFISNGFKIRNTYGGSNTNNAIYLYMAFAESPFKTANAR